MKYPTVFLLALVSAVPLVALPGVADAQVSSQPRPIPRMLRSSLSPAEEVRLFDRQRELARIDARIAQIQAAAQTTGALTADQEARLQRLYFRRDGLRPATDLVRERRDDPA